MKIRDAEEILRDTLGLGETKFVNRMLADNKRDYGIYEDAGKICYCHWMTPEDLRRSQDFAYNAESLITWMRESHVMPAGLSRGMENRYLLAAEVLLAFKEISAFRKSEEGEYIFEDCTDNKDGKDQQRLWEYEVLSKNRARLEECAKVLDAKIAQQLDFDAIKEMDQLISVIRKDPFYQELVFTVTVYRCHFRERNGVRGDWAKKNCTQYSFGNVRLHENLDVVEIRVYDDCVEVGYHREGEFRMDRKGKPDDYKKSKVEQLEEVLLQTLAYWEKLFE